MEGIDGSMLERTLLFMFLIMSFVKENCYATLSDVSRLLGSLPLFSYSRGCSFLPHSQYGNLEHLCRSCRMILESGGKENEWRWNIFEPSCKDS